MTREEAIEIIRKEYACVDADCDIERNCGRCELHMPSKEPILKAYEMAIQALSQEPCDDAISREAVMRLIENKPYDWSNLTERHNMLMEIRKLPSVTQKSGKWIPVSERLPEDLEAVNITWVNHEPEPYYHDIKDRNFVATGIYYRGQWYWYSTTCADYLGEYGSNEIDKVDDAVEIIAWMPLPKPYEPQESEEGK